VFSTPRTDSSNSKALLKWTHAAPRLATDGIAAGKMAFKGTVDESNSARPAVTASHKEIQMGHRP